MFEISNSATGAEIGTWRNSTGTGGGGDTGVWFFFSDSASITLTFKVGGGWISGSAGHGVDIELISSLQ